MVSTEVKYCWTCDNDTTWVENESLELVCSGCGSIDHSSMALSEIPDFEKPNPWAKRHHKAGYRACADPCKRPALGRYKEKFHFNERVSQWMCKDPRIPDSDWNRIQAAADSGKYGRKEDFSRATVIIITRDLKLQKYRERWKTILCRLSPMFRDFWLEDEEMTPEPSFLEWAKFQFNEFVTQFYLRRNEMPNSLTRTKKGNAAVVLRRNRHNFISYNYIFRQLLLMYGDLTHNEEFPLPRSHTKLHALDDVMENMCLDLGIESDFQRSAVIKRPKLKRK